MVFWQPAISRLVAVSIMALQLLRLSYTLLPLSTTIDVNDEHPLKDSSSITCTLLGMVIAFSEEQPQNARPRIRSTLFGRVIEVSAACPSNANPSIEVTP